MKQVFTNTTPVEIPATEPTVVNSLISVFGLSGQVQQVTVSMDLLHTYTQDLRIILIAPTGQEILLVSRVGGSGDNFLGTSFDDGAPLPIMKAVPPFTGTFQPEVLLSTLQGIDPNGQWTLRIVDVAYQDGGILNRWSLGLTITEPRPSDFTINVRFLGGLSATQQAVFEAAAARWSAIISGDLPPVTVDGDLIDDVLIEAQGSTLDGPSGILGQAGPTRLRSGSLLPVKGIMEFDVGDLAQLEANGGLLNVIIHEMGHVLGIGTIWQTKRLITGTGSPNPIFTGMNAMREFAALTGSPAPTPVPVANAGGPGTRDGHWRESVFGNELMTGFLDPAQNPISRLTIASLEDLGYTVNYDAADPYELPTQLQLALMGIGADTYGRWQCSMCGSNHPGSIGPVIVVPEATVVPE